MGAYQTSGHKTTSKTAIQLHYLLKDLDLAKKAEKGDYRE